MFALLVIGHLLANYNAVKSVVMETFNRNRFHIMVVSYLLTGHVRTPQSVNSEEPVLTSVSRYFTSIQLGCSIERLATSTPTIDSSSLARFARDKYLIDFDTKGKFSCGFVCS